MKEILLSPKIIVLIIAILLIVGGGIGLTVYQGFIDKEKTAQGSEVEQLVQKVGELVDLPQEQPTVATVTDKDKLGQYPFFANAQLGDKVLIFNGAKKAYLFRPSTGKLIEVGPIMVSGDEASGSATQAEVEMKSAEASVAAAKTKTATLAILNGTKGKGLAAKAEEEIADQKIAVSVKVKSNAENDYEKTQITVINKESSSIAEKLAAHFKAEIVPLPQGEDKPSTDIVVFLGKERL